MWVEWTCYQNTRNHEITQRNQYRVRFPADHCAVLARHLAQFPIPISLVTVHCLIACMYELAWKRKLGNEVGARVGRR